jgi:hypothetical protein
MEALYFSETLVSTYESTHADHSPPSSAEVENEELYLLYHKRLHGV